MSTPLCELHTARLCLRAQTRDETLAWIETLPAEVRAEVSPAWIARVHASAEGDPWHCGFVITLVQDDGQRVVVGQCAYKDQPNAAGDVEIAYGIDEAYQRRGFATEAAQALVDFALADSRVRRVLAHTQPEPNASTRVLAKCGFRLEGEVLDPEDGRVWRWVRDAAKSRIARIEPST